MYGCVSMSSPFPEKLFTEPSNLSKSLTSGPLMSGTNPPTSLPPNVWSRNSVLLFIYGNDVHLSVVFINSLIVVELIAFHIASNGIIILTL
uniref:Ovule protein n=1 Tax=Heterorhabditis bacteriophora TaxID=37862 RepID=A0A1I7WK00_HETBA